MPFIVTTAGCDPLNLRKLLERFANERWMPDHTMPEEMVAMVLDQFRRQIVHDLGQLEVTFEPAV